MIKKTNQKENDTKNKTRKHGKDEEEVEVPTSRYLVSCSNRLSSACILCFPLVSEEVEKD